MRMRFTRVARIRVAGSAVELEPLYVAEVLQHLIVLRCEYNFATMSFEMVCAGGELDEVPFGNEMPTLMLVARLRWTPGGVQLVGYKLGTVLGTDTMFENDPITFEPLAAPEGPADVR